MKPPAARGVATAVGAGALGGTASLVWTRDLGQAAAVFLVGSALGSAIFLAAAAGDGDDGGGGDGGDEPAPDDHDDTSDPSTARRP